MKEIQSLLEEAILKDANAVCSEKHGWLPEGVEIKCRNILCSIIEETLSERGEYFNTMNDNKSITLCYLR